MLGPNPKAFLGLRDNGPVWTWGSNPTVANTTSGSRGEATEHVGQVQNCAAVGYNNILVIPSLQHGHFTDVVSVQNYKSTTFHHYKKVSNYPMSKLQYLNEVKSILNAFEDSDITAHQFLHGLLSTNIFADHPVTLSIIEDLDTILDTVSSAQATSDRTRQWVFRSAENGYQAHFQKWCW